MVQRSAESHSLANIAGMLATAADQLREVAGRYDGLAGHARRMQRGRLAHDLSLIGEACHHAAHGFTDLERSPPMNWSAIPWQKLILLASAIALTIIAVRVPDTLIIAGVSLQHALLVAAGAAAGWVKRAPGDIKAA